MHDACIENSIFTQILTTTKYLGKGTYRFYHTIATHPSFEIASKPAIRAIDVITYTLGAMGSWIGFSFLNLNPTAFAVAIKNRVTRKENSPDIEIESNNDMQYTRYELYLLRHKVHRMNMLRLRSDRVIEDL